MPERHSAIVPQCHSATVPECQSATVPQCQSARVPECQSATVPGPVPAPVSVSVPVQVHPGHSGSLRVTMGHCGALWALWATLGLSGAFWGTLVHSWALWGSPPPAAAKSKTSKTNRPWDAISFECAKCIPRPCALIMSVFLLGGERVTGGRLLVHNGSHIGDEGALCSLCPRICDHRHQEVATVWFC